MAARTWSSAMQYRCTLITSSMHDPAILMDFCRHSSTRLGSRKSSCNATSKKGQHPGSNRHCRHGKTHIVLPSLPARHLVLPPEMTRREDRRRLLGLLEQAVAVQSGLCDERVVVVWSEDSRRLESTDDDGDGLQLSPTLRDGLLVDDERLDVELVGKLLQACIVGDLGSEQEKAKTGLRRFNPVVEGGDELVNKLEGGRDLGLPVVVLRDPELGQ